MEINSDESDGVFVKNSAKKRKPDQSLWKRNIVKVSRIKGDEYVNYQGNTVPQKCTGFPCSCKRNNCLETINEEDQMDIFNHFHAFNTKDEQDLFLQSLIDSQEVKQRRPRKEDSSKKKKCYL
nr:uncharacterized protein LOC124808279 isoform X2 [Hydra vulgaris]